MMMNNLKNKGFTLAEVLITLAIIGIVAALTIPNLIFSYKKKIIDTRMINFISNLTNTLKFASIDNGEIANWEFGSDTNHRDTELYKKWYDKYMAPYMKNIKTTEKASAPTTSESPSGSGVFDVYFLDGSVMRFEHLRSYDFGFYYFPKGMPEGVRNFTQSPQVGIDCFYFVIMKKLNDGAINAYYKTGTYKNYTKEDWREKCASAQSGQRGASCTMLLELNNWKVPEDYPLNL